MRSLFAGPAEDRECRPKQKTVNGSDKCFKAFWQANQRSTTVSKLGARHVQSQSQGTVIAPAPPAVTVESHRVKV